MSKYSGPQEIYTAKLGSINHPRILTVLLEYIPSKNRVCVRGVWPAEDYPRLPPTEKGAVQNHINVFEGIEAKVPVGITILK